VRHAVTLDVNVPQFRTAGLALETVGTDLSEVTPLVRPAGQVGTPLEVRLLMPVDQIRCFFIVCGVVLKQPLAPHQQRPAFRARLVVLWRTKQWLPLWHRHSRSLALLDGTTALLAA